MKPPTPFATTSTIYYRSDNTTVATNSGGKFFLYRSYTYPSTVRAGDAGSIGTGTQFNPDCTQTALAATITNSYVVSTDTATTLLISVVSDEKDFGGGETNVTTVYRIDINGNATLVSITTVQSFLASAYQKLTFTF
jgi:hypothetical protein